MKQATTMTPNPKVMIGICIALALAGMYLGLYVL